jgi:hypothetical protein
VATATLKTGVRVPDTPEATMMPLTHSLPLVEAIAGKAVIARLASAIPAASSAPVTWPSPAWTLTCLAGNPGMPGLEPWPEPGNHVTWTGIGALFGQNPPIQTGTTGSLGRRMDRCALAPRLLRS